MTKIIFLIPPSEGKNSESKHKKEKLSFNFEKPLEIAINASKKDLKCIGNRYIEGIELNKNILNGEYLQAINRYNGIMYSSINYDGKTEKGKNFFKKHIYILSGMYGIIRPKDYIGNYKLPIETKGLYNFWGDKIVKKLSKLKIKYIVSLLPESYSKLIGIGKSSKLIQIKNILADKGIKIININFLKPDGKTLSHGVKKYKGEFIRKICEENIIDYKKFGGEIYENGNIIEVNMIFNQAKLSTKK